MRIKRFAARDLPAVVAQIKEEFGLQAIILSQRSLPDGHVEVTAGVRDEDLPPGVPVGRPDGGPVGEPEEEPGEGAEPFAEILRAEADQEPVKAADLAASASPPPPRARPLGPAAGSDPSATGVRAGTLGPIGPVGPAGPARGARQEGRGPAGPPVKSLPSVPSGAAPRVPSVPSSQPAPSGPDPRAQAAPSGADPRAQAAPSDPDPRAQAAPRTPSVPSGGAPSGPASRAQAAPRTPSAPGGAAPSGPVGAPRAQAAPTAQVPGRLMPRAAPGVAPKPAPLTAPAMGAAAYRKVQATPPVDDVARRLSDLGERVGEGFEELRNLLMDLAHRQSLSERWRDRQDLVGLYRRLLATDLDPVRARELVEKAAGALEAWGGELLEHLKGAVKPLIRCLPPETPLPRLVALAGPSGSGKTTALVRLAAFCQRRGQKVSAITLDTLRLGAAEQLSQYARIMGLGLKACQTGSQFTEALEIFEDSELILVDTNSRDLGAAPKSAAEEPYRALRAAGAKFLLTLPAGLKTGDLSRLHERLAGPDLLGLVLTKLDETATLGNALTFLAEAAAPLAFISTGPRTPEDFQAAKADRLIELWLGS